MSVLPSAALTDAVAHHQRGELSQAAQLYQHILSHDPNNAEALHLLGVACLQGGQPHQAIEWMERAVALEPNISAFHANFGEAYRALCQLGRAVGCYQLALRLRPIMRTRLTISARYSCNRVAPSRQPHCSAKPCTIIRTSRWHTTTSATLATCSAKPNWR